MVSLPPQAGVNAAFAWVTEWAEKRRAEGLRRQLRHRRADDDLLDLAGNDYLGLSRHPEVIRGTVAAAGTWGAGSTGSRLVTGSTTLHAELEAALAEFTGWPAGLVFSTGYLANLGTIAALAGRGDLVVSDALNHASIVDACRLSRARVAVAAHRSAAAVAAALVSRSEERAIVVTDAVFSVDGDLAPLRDLHAIAREHGAGLLVDEAHSLGVIGDAGHGAIHAAGLAGEPDIIAVATLSKALGSQGGVVLAAPEIIDHLVDASRTFIFDTGLAPAAAGAALAALSVLRREPWRAAAVRQAAVALADHATGVGLVASRPQGAVVSIVIGSPDAALAAAETCAAHGVRVGCFRPPSVPDGASRLRLTARADLTAAGLARAKRALADVAALTESR